MTNNRLTFNCMIAGVGGQGTVLASKLIAAAAMKSGFDVRTTETIGMAQRGGSVVSHVRIGSNNYSPLIPPGKAEALIAFEPAEAVRQLPFLCTAAGTGQILGTVIVCDTAISPAGAMLEFLKANVAKLVVIKGERLMLENAKTLNVAVLGAAVQSGIFPFDADILKAVLPEMLHERFLAANINAFEKGREVYNETIR